MKILYQLKKKKRKNKRKKVGVWGGDGGWVREV